MSSENEIEHNILLILINMQAELENRAITIIRTFMAIHLFRYVENAITNLKSILRLILYIIKILHLRRLYKLLLLV